MSAGLVTIVRKKGRIAGFGSPRTPTQILWCGSNRPRKKAGARSNGWSFPPAVREMLLQECNGKTVLHLFGGRADFGIRLDIDPSTRPDVIGDAWLPPFAESSFDVVILDPPYIALQRQEKEALLRAAAFCARDLVIWFSTVWISDISLVPQRAWLVRVGDQCSVRCLQIFKVKENKLPPVTRFTRGPAMKYNRWLAGEQQLPFADLTPAAFAHGRDLPRSTNSDISDLAPAPYLEAVTAGVNSSICSPAVKSDRSKSISRRST